MVIPVGWIGVAVFVDTRPVARTIWIAAGVFVAAALHRGSRVGVSVLADEVRIVNFFKTIHLARGDIDHFEADVMWPDVKRLSEEHLARVILSNGEEIVVTGLKPRYSMLTRGTEEELRDKVAELNAFLGFEPSAGSSPSRSGS